MKRLLILLSFFPFTAVFSQQIVTRPDGRQMTILSIDNNIKQLIRDAGVTGLCLGIIQNNKPVYIHSYGYKNLADKIQPDTSTVLYGASFSKSLFAYIVMQLVDEGKIGLDKPLYQYLPKPIPEYEDYTDLATDDRWKLITARQCLDHTTGFPNWRFLNPKGNNKLEFFFTPGERYAYSGEGIRLLQVAVEAITGKDLAELAKERVFIPFGMQHTAYIWDTAFEKNYALGYDNDNNVLVKRKRNKSNAAGSMETTIADFTRFLAAVMQGRNISTASKKEMFTPQIGIYTRTEFPSLNTDTSNNNRNISLSYGLGWGLFKSSYGLAFFKEGHDDGWEHYCIAFPDKGYALVIMTNSSNGESVFKELVEKLSGATIPWVWEGYIPYRKTISLVLSRLQQYTGTYKNDMLTVTVSLENGSLKIEAPSEGLPKSTLYAIDKTHFFLKTMDADIQFIKDENGKVVGADIKAEGEIYKLKRTE